MSVARYAESPESRELFQAVAELASYLERRLAGGAAPDDTFVSTPQTLGVLSERLSLDRFEQELLLLGVGCALDARFRALVARCSGDAERPWLSLGLAFDCLPGGLRSSLSPRGKLRRWRLIELVGRGDPFEARVLLDEAVLHYLLGVSYADERLEPWLRLEASSRADVAPGDPEILRLAAEWQRAATLAQTAVARLEVGDAETFARGVANALGLELHRLRDAELPHEPHEREQFARLWERQALLRGALLWVDVDACSPEQARRLGGFLESLQSLILVSGEARLPLRRAQHRCSASVGDAASRLAIWQAVLGSRAGVLNGHLSGLAEQFELTGTTIRRLGQGWRESAEVDAESLWAACRVEARRGLDALASRVESRAGWDDLVLPAASLTALRAIVAQVRQRGRVYRDWGFAERGGRGLGISALFSGGSGTGKTLAAEVLANELELDLYRIDLSALVSKYIGETEKNLARVFAAAETSGAILLFDEADALFGKRSEVRDSHDRYANLEVSYLLQRIETYRGLAILTSNLKQSLDAAFQRRLRFVVSFPFPDLEARSRIWSSIFPAAAPLVDVDVAKLARLSLSGGHIRNLALNAAFLAADEAGAIGMRHLRLAAEAEFVKLEKPLPHGDVGDWQ